MISKNASRKEIGYFDLYASQALPPPPEIDFFDVLDDFEEKKKFGTKKKNRLRNFSQFFLVIFFT